MWIVVLGEFGVYVRATFLNYIETRLASLGLRLLFWMNRKLL